MDDEMTREAFFEVVTQPGVPDEMNFVLRKAHGDSGTFSAEGFEAVGYQMHDFVVARTLGHWRETGRAPTGVTVQMRLVWDAPTDEQLKAESEVPWYSLDDVGAALTSPDGEHRLSTFLSRRRSDG